MEFSCKDNAVVINELRCEKNGLWCFRPGPTITNLYSCGKKASSLKIWVNVEEELYCTWGEYKGADQLCSYCTTDLRLCFRLAKIWFSHDAVKMTNVFFVLLIQILFHIWGCVVA